jgi:hypothetical protein
MEAEQSHNPHSIIDEEGNLRIQEMTNGELRIRYVLGENPGEAQVILTWIYDDPDLEPVAYPPLDMVTTPTALGRNLYVECLQKNADQGIAAVAICLPLLLVPEPN